MDDSVLNDVRVRMADISAKTVDRWLLSQISDVGKKIFSRGRKIRDGDLLKVAAVAMAVVERRRGRREKRSQLKLL